ncbi:ParB N-terminal domain-containing protein [Brevundimonas sp.]|uniref:ParB N-terminal domain-containing protein n=1 Tax=Brevundimonas sp. TaxID=1871086 RepID=UPI0035ADE731
MNISIDQITTFDRVRQASRPQVDALVASIREVGLLNPITVAPTDSGFALVAGMHRLEACRVLGMTAVPAITLDLDANQRVIAECDENLCASTLTASERAEFTRRRKAAYEALHPETRREATLKRGDEAPSRQVGETGKPARFTADTAAATGQSERAVQRDAERGEKVSDDALSMIRGSRLDTGKYLDSIKNLTSEEQVAKVKADLAPSDPDEKRDTDAATVPQVSNQADPAETKLRRAISQMPDEAKIDEIIGLRAEVKDLRAERAGLKSEVAKLKEQLRGHEGDKDETIRRLSRTIEHKNSEMFRANENFAIEKRKNKRLEKEVNRLKAEAENQVIEL